MTDNENTNEHKIELCKDLSSLLKRINLTEKQWEDMSEDGKLKTLSYHCFYTLPHIPKRGKFNIGGNDYYYATLEDLLFVVRSHIPQFGGILRLTQRMEGEYRCCIECKIIFLFCEGEIVSTLHFTLGQEKQPNNKIHYCASMLTVMTRRCILLALGIHPDDDPDGNDVSEQEKPSSHPVKTQPVQKKTYQPYKTQNNTQTSRVKEEWIYDVDQWELRINNINTQDENFVVIINKAYGRSQEINNTEIYKKVYQMIYRKASENGLYMDTTNNRYSLSPPPDEKTPPFDDEVPF